MAIRRKFGRYYLVRLIGEGSHALVFEALCPTNGRVALKVLRAELATDREAAARFEREISLALELEHPYLARAYDAGTENGRQYIAFELLRGGSLADRLANDGAFGVMPAIDIARQILEALTVIHDAGAVHRDVKPSNVLFASDGTAHLADFGLARYVGVQRTTVTQPGFAIGSPAYLAPEQARGLADLDHRCDLYSLGVLMFHCLAGEPPFTSQNPLELITQHLEETPPSLLSRCPSAPPALGALVDRLLQKRPADRPSSAAEILRLLKPVSIDVPVDTAPEADASA